MVLDRVNFDVTEVPPIFFVPHFDLSKHETFFSVFSNIFDTPENHVNVPSVNIKISNKSNKLIQEKVFINYIIYHILGVLIV